MCVTNGTASPQAPFWYRHISDQRGIVNSLLYILAMLQLPTSRRKGMPREAAFLAVSFWPGGDFSDWMSALIPPSAPALQLLKMDHDCFSPGISLSYVPSLLLYNFSPFFSSLLLIFPTVIFYASPAAAMNHDSPWLRAYGAPQQAQCAECISPLVAPQRGPTVQPLLWVNMSTSGGDIISS